MISASSLVRHCRYEKVLKSGREVPPDQQAKIDAGTRFHAAVEAWIRDGALPELENDPEVQGWLDLLASGWIPPVNTECEIAWGLDLAGAYVDVDEPEPHVYVARDGRELLTAGRADVAFDWRGVLYVVDWKTGKWAVTPAASNLQVHAAGIALAQRAGATSYRPAIYYVRDGHFDGGDEVPLNSPAHVAMLAEVREAAFLDDEPHPGDWCGRCWVKRQCPKAAA